MLLSYVCAAVKHRTLIRTQLKRSKNVSGNKRATLKLLEILCLTYQFSQYLDIFISAYHDITP